MRPRGRVEVYLYSSMTAALEGGEWSAARPGRTLPPGKDPVPILQEAGWAPGPVWTGGKSRPHRDSIPDRLARSSVAIATELPGPELLPSARIKNKCSHTSISSTRLRDVEMEKLYNFLLICLQLNYSAFCHSTTGQCDICCFPSNLLLNPVYG